MAHSSELESGDDEAIAVKTIETASQTTESTAKELSAPELPPERREALTRRLESLERTTEDIAERFPESPKVQVAAARQALQARDWARGLRHADAAVEKAQAAGDKAALADALRARASGAWYAQDFPRAAADAKRGLELAPGDERLTGIYQLSKGRLRGEAPAKGAAAPGERERPLASALGDPRLKEAGDRALARQEALRRLEEARRRMDMGDSQGALPALDAALRADPLLPDAYMHRALAWSALREIAKALVDVTKAIELWTARGDAPLAADGLTLRAQLRDRGGDPRGAAQDAGRAIALAPEKAGGYAERAKALEALGEKAERVLADFKRAAELDPASYSPQYQAAIARHSKEDAAPAAPEAPARRLGRAIMGALALLSLPAGAAFWLLLRRRRKPRTSRELRRLDSQYDLGEVVGEGGMGAVYKGLDRALKRPVAIKRLRSELQGNRRERERFLKEAELVASLHHPHIVDIYTILQDGEQVYLVFEYVEGKTMHDLLNDTPGRRLPPARALELLRQSCEAVDHAHGRGVIHRDLKPSNIMVADGGWAKVMDFGIARQVKDSLMVTTNTIVGTPIYMAPEQSLGRVAKESDVFAMGCTLYEMLTGAVPYRGAAELQDKLDARFLAASALFPDLGTAIDAVLRKALAPRPEGRYGSAMELYRAAAAALNERSAPASRG